TDTAGGLSVIQAQTSNGDIELEAAGALADLTLTNVSASGHTATLQAAGAVNGATVGTAAVVASNVSITAGTGVGTVNPFEIDSSTLSAVVQSAGNLRVKDTAGGLNVILGQTFSGEIEIEAAGAASDLTL